MGEYPGNVTVIPGLKKNDAKRHALCTQGHTMCKFRNRKCDSRSSGEKSWCFISYIRNPLNPTQNCYADVRWSDTHGSFYSHEACEKLEGKDNVPEPDDNVPEPDNEPTTSPSEPAPGTEQVPVPDSGTVHPLGDEPTTNMPAEALDTSTNPPVEQEDGNVPLDNEQEDGNVPLDNEQEDGNLPLDNEQEDGNVPFDNEQEDGNVPLDNEQEDGN